MKDQDKSKEQLMDDLAALRQRVAELEATEADRRRMEETLKSSEERLRVIFEFAPDAYYLSDPSGHLIDGNKAAEALIGYERSGLVGKNFLKLGLLSTDQIPKAAALLTQNVLGRRTGPDEFVLNRKDGTCVAAEISTHPVRIDGQVMVLGIARNITDHRQAEEEREGLIVELREALNQVRTLSGLLPICANCKRIRDDQGYWHQVEAYVRDHSEAEFSHSICPDCFAELYPGFLGDSE